MSEYVLSIAGREYRAEVAELTAERARIVVNGTAYDVDLVEIGRRPAAIGPAPAAGDAPRPAPSAPAAAAPRPAPAPAGTGAVQAPLPGLILQVKVKEGDAVQAGQAIVVMEAMKMENVVPSPHNGTVRKVLVKEGDSVAEGDVLLEVARPGMTTL
jgi:biotin carboxyl carrier protein